MKMIVLVMIPLTFCRGYAHELRLEREGESCVLYSGHRHSGHEGEEIVSYSPEIVLWARCFDEEGGEIEAGIGPASPVKIDCDGAILYVMTSSGYWTKTPYGTRNVPKDQVSMPVRSWLSFESVKRVGSWNEKLSRPLTSELELIPLNDPLALEKNGKIRLLVTYQGRPVEGAVVSCDGKPRGRTGEDGRVNIRLRHDGFQAIQASYTLPLDTEKADEAVHSTNLNFETGSGR